MSKVTATNPTKVNKTQFVDALAKQMGTSKIKSEEALNKVIDTIVDLVSQGIEVNLTGFGSFKVTHRKARDGRNPKDGTPLKIGPSKTPKFTAGKTFKEAIQN
jgi:nucleoid DNA-binding protein